MTALLLLFCLAAPAAELDTLHAQRRSTMQVGMATLGGWAVVNLAAGGVGFATAQDERLRWFHGTNALWNTVNLGLAIPGLIAASREEVGAFEGHELLRRGRSTEKVFLFNAGLDVGYMMGGLFLREYGLRIADDRFVGGGEAMLLQGGFLFAFDLVMFLLVNAVDKKMHVELAPGAVAFRF